MQPEQCLKYCAYFQKQCIQQATLVEQIPNGLPEAESEESESSSVVAPMTPVSKDLLTIDLKALSNILDLNATLPEDLKFNPEWSHVTRVGPSGDPISLMFYQLDTEADPPTMLKSIKVNENMEFDAYHRLEKITFLAKRKTYLFTGKVKTWKGILRLLKFLEEFIPDAFPFDFSPQKTFRVQTYASVMELLSKRKQELHSVDIPGQADFQEGPKLNFIMEQIALLDTAPDDRKFTDTLKAWSKEIAVTSHDIFTFLSHSGALTLPKPSSIFQQFYTDLTK